MTFELVQESDEFPLQAVPNPYLDWQYVADESHSSPHSILDTLMVAKDFDLARHWAKVHGVFDSVWQVSDQQSVDLLTAVIHWLECDTEQGKAVTFLSKYKGTNVQIWENDC